MPSPIQFSHDDKPLFMSNLACSADKRGRSQFILIVYHNYWPTNSSEMINQVKYVQYQVWIPLRICRSVHTEASTDNADPDGRHSSWAVQLSGGPTQASKRTCLGNWWVKWGFNPPRYAGGCRLITFESTYKAPWGGCKPSLITVFWQWRIPHQTLNLSGASILQQTNDSND